MQLFLRRRRPCTTGSSASGVWRRRRGGHGSTRGGTARSCAPPPPARRSLTIVPAQAEQLQGTDLRAGRPSRRGALLPGCKAPHCMRAGRHADTLVHLQVAKNIVLAGVGSVTLVDDRPANQAPPGNFLVAAHAASGSDRRVALPAERHLAPPAARARPERPPCRAAALRAPAWPRCKR
jgi:hypothetical protein